MCGIAGEIRFDGGAASWGALSAMVDSMEARGPDGGGALLRGPTALGHRRLKIIDLSERAQQPMVDAELGLALVFNGCIYNYRDLRRELDGQGYRFFSDGDSEVILKAYHAWGWRAVERLNGMFAFAIAERDSGRLLLARDRLGIKPLYLAEDGSRRLRFASSLGALLAAGEVDTGIDPVALHHYMHFHSVVPPPHTILRGVRKLPPATVLELDADGTRQQHCYWEPRFDAGGERRSPQEWGELVLTGLRAAVLRRLEADVPVGVLLSGGLDSSLITALLAEHGATLSTFSIGFESCGEEAGDEFRYSDAVVERFGTDHHRIFVDEAEFLPHLPGCIAAQAEPMVSHDVIGFYLLSREVSRHVRVVQSGQGADEVFAGYRWYPPMLESTDHAGDYARVFFDRDHAEYARAVEPALLDGDHSRRFVERHFARPGARTGIDRALRIDTTVMLVDDPVKRVDNMTMAFGLEARVPFLDHELVELAAVVPPELKLACGGKGILKEIARPLLPASVIDRPKGYFPVPALKYLRGAYLALVRDALDSRRCRDRGIIRREYIEDLYRRQPEERLTPLGGSKLWQLGLLELWLRERNL
jgi:asparagine synthase (glutamine-hydrolysing)